MKILNECFFKIIFQYTNIRIKRVYYMIISGSLLYGFTINSLHHLLTLKHYINLRIFQQPRHFKWSMGLNVSMIYYFYYHILRPENNYFTTYLFNNVEFNLYGSVSNIICKNLKKKIDKTIKCLKSKFIIKQKNIANSISFRAKIEPEFLSYNFV